MSRNRKRRSGVGAIYSFAAVWLVMAFILPLYRVWGLAITIGLSVLAAFLVGKRSAKKQMQAEAEEQQAQAAAAAARKPAEEKAPEKSYGPEVDAILKEGNRALSEMGRLYMSIKDPEVRRKINEIMRITDKIAQDAIEDPSDIPQIKKFMNYYLPTTIKLLNAYDRMSAQGIEGENLDKSMKNINEMLDTAIEAYKKRLDSLFANQALDIESDIEVMNTMLEREGLAGEKDFKF